mgnify:CR=1 FL=1
MNIELKRKQDELEEIRQKMIIEAGRLYQVFRDSAQANADYENAKNHTLIGLYSEESDSKGTIKRTESIRQAIYRELHKDLRLARDLAKNEMEATRTYLNLLGMMQMNLQSQLRLESESEKH